MLSYLFLWQLTATLLLTPFQVGENIQIRRFEKFNLGEGLEKRSNDFAAEVAQQTQAKAKEDAKPKAAEAPKAKEAPKAAAPAVAISAAVVKQLRDKVCAGDS